jgi:hypothetical protein
MAVMVPAVTADSIVERSDLDLDDYARALDGLVLQGGNDIAPQAYGEAPLDPIAAAEQERGARVQAMLAASAAGTGAGASEGGSSGVIAGILTAAANRLHAAGRRDRPRFGARWNRLRGWGTKTGP